MNDNDNQMNLINEFQPNIEQQKQDIFHVSDYQQASSEEIMVEFARNSYPLIGAVIDGNFIKGEFGYGQIQQPKNQRLVKLQNNKLSLVEQVSKIIITKSTLKKKEIVIQNKQKQDLQENNSKIMQKNLNQNQQKGNWAQNLRQQEQNQEEQRFFSQSSKSSDEQDRKQRQNTANRIKKKALIKKSQSEKNTNKISKNVLKKKLKYLSRR